MKQKQYNKGQDVLNTLVATRISQQEHDKLIRSCREAGLSKSEYLRHSLLEKLDLPIQPKNNKGKDIYQEIVDEYEQPY